MWCPTKRAIALTTAAEHAQEVCFPILEEIHSDVQSIKTAAGNCQAAGEANAAMYGLDDWHTLVSQPMRTRLWRLQGFISDHWILETLFDARGSELD